MIATARKHSKFPGMAGVYSKTIMPRYIETSVRFVLGDGWKRQPTTARKIRI
jgi:hypothetical protein